MTIIGKLLEEYNKIEQGLEISETVRYNEGNDDSNQMFVSLPNTEEIYLPDEEEYARVMSVLETWLKSNPVFRRKKYLRKEIQSTEVDKTYAYTFKKLKANEYILIDKEEIENDK